MTNFNSVSAELRDAPLISVIMNCYNSERFLREALESVMAQTYQNWEIIFWDNQSTDKSAEILKSYKDSRIKYFYAPNHTVLGLGRNLAIECASGQWLGFLDCDDLWLPMKLEKQVAVINAHGVELGLVYSEVENLIEEDGKSTVMGSKLARQPNNKLNQDCPSGYIFAAMLKGNSIPLVSALVRHSAFVEVGGVNPELRQAEDYDLFVKITQNFQAIAVNEVTCLYRIHQSNVTHAQSEKSYTESILVVQRFLPHPDAVEGLRIWQANYAGYLFSNRRFIEGALTLYKSKRFFYFIAKVLIKLRESFKKDLDGKQDKFSNRIFSGAKKLTK
jgi:glycosyltransferase involved in cell wall biosynthesis